MSLGFLSIRFPMNLFILLTILAMAICGSCEQLGGILQLKHRYSHKEGSSKHNGHKGMSRGHFDLLRDHDAARRGRILADAADFPLGGSADPSAGGGLYFTEVSLGSPAKTYTVQVDTGSDVLWVNCRPCMNCPRRSELNIPLTLYDPQASSTMSAVPCSDPLCTLGVAANEADCDSNSCVYNFQYGDGSTTSGYYVKDFMQYTLMNTGGSTLANATSKIIFGCSTNQSGDLTSSDQAVDGIMGFGQLALSVPSQISSDKNIPKVFSHCLEGEQQGGGILVIGQVSETGIQYTPLIPNSSHYNVNLISILVGSTALPIDSEQLSSSDQRGVIFDSGTTLAYFPSSAYTTIVNAILSATTSAPMAYDRNMGQCFLVSGGLSSSFPSVTLNFAGSASMVLSPRNYLILMGNEEQGGRRLPLWCIGWQSSGSSSGPKDDTRLTILGDIVLKDKLVVYDLENSQLGWKSFNCSASIKVGGHAVGATHLDSGVGSTAGGVVIATTVLLAFCTFAFGFLT